MIQLRITGLSSRTATVLVVSSGDDYETEENVSFFSTEVMVFKKGKGALKVVPLKRQKDQWVHLRDIQGGSFHMTDLRPNTNYQAKLRIFFVDGSVKELIEPFATTRLTVQEQVELKVAEARAQGEEV